MTGTPSAGRQAVCVAKGQEDMSPQAWLSGRLWRREGEWESKGQGFIFWDNRLQPRAHDLVRVQCSHGAR